MTHDLEAEAASPVASLDELQQQPIKRLVFVSSPKKIFLTLC